MNERTPWLCPRCQRMNAVHTDVCATCADESATDILANFRQGWKEVMTGQTLPVSKLWDELNTADI